MRRSFCIFGMVAILAGTAAAQDGKEAAPAPVQEMPLPKPGPEHEILKQDVGTWDGSIEMKEPGGKTELSKGVETNAAGYLLTKVGVHEAGTFRIVFG